MIALIRHRTVFLFFGRTAWWMVLLTGCFVLGFQPGFRAEKGEPVEQWMSITMGGMSVGHTWLSLQPLAPARPEYEEGFRFRFQETMTIPGLRSETTAYLYEDLTLGRFHLAFDGMDMGQGSYQSRGRMEEEGLVVLVMSEGTPSRQVFEVEHGHVYLSNAIHYAMVQQELQPGWKGRFPVFDPTMQAHGEVTARVEALEKVVALEREFSTARVLMEFMGIEQTSWITRTGLRVRDEALDGMAVSVLTSRDTAESGGEALLEALGLQTFMLDLAERFQVEQQGRIAHPRECRRLVVNLSGIEPAHVVQDGYWQEVRQDPALGRDRFQVEIRYRPELSPDRADPMHLEADLLVQSDAPEIRKQAREIVGSSEEDEEKVKKILQWVYGNLDRSRLRLTVPSAAEVLKSRSGDCNEHAVLFAALARAVGVPTRICAGLTYAHGFLGPGTEGFYYHAWNEVFLEGQGWIPLDSTLNQMPADATHLKLVEGSMAEQVRLLNVVGKLHVEIVSESRE